MNKRNIMIISIHGDPTAEIGSEEQGGQPIYIKDICRLLSRDFQIDIFTRKNAFEENIVELFPGVNVIKVEAGPVEFIPKEEIYLYLNEFFMNTSRWIEQNKKEYSLVHSHYWYSGRITKAKGLRILIKALARVKREFNKELKLFIIGGDVSNTMHSEIESNEKKYIKKLINKINLSDDVIFFGLIEREKLPYYYSIADICVVPSLYESFGLMAVEAMACGTPVIASKVGGLAHTVKNGYSGLHFVHGRSDHLAKKILGIITDSERLKEMGINARIRAAKEFGLERTLRQIKGLYESLIF